MKHFFYKSVICLMLVLLLLGNWGNTVYAKNASGAAAFDNLTWEKILEKSVTRKNGVVQAICATDDYIICLENAGDTSKEKDIAYAYYKNNQDENGNPVEQYSLAFKNDKWDWEHCNGMCYNPDNDEIYVALYTNNDPESRGCIYVMDPHTLDYKGKIKIADNYNILGIGYYPEKGRYIIQANAEGDYGIKILDGNFQKLFDAGAADLGLGSNSQDLCVCGDYVMNFPLTFDQDGVGSYMNVYSVDYGRPEDPDDYEIRFQLLKEVQMELETSGNTKVEPESICEVEDGVFIVTVNIMNDKGKRKYAWYKTVLGGYQYEIKTECSNGTISATDEILTGGNYTVSYKPDNGYVLSSITVDGIAVDPKEYPASYTFSDVSADHSISVVYTEKEVVTGSQLSESKTDTYTRETKQKMSAKLKILLVAIPVLIAVILGVRRYIQHLRIERRKKYLTGKIRREKERVALQKAMQEMESIPEDSSLEAILREIDEMERGGTGKSSENRKTKKNQKAGRKPATDKNQKTRRKPGIQKTQSKKVRKE